MADGAADGGAGEGERGVWLEVDPTLNDETGFGRVTTVGLGCGAGRGGWG